jgi:hypothetical protein
MTTPFTNSLTGQQGSLVRAQIKSPNFNLAQLIGWAILKNGNAYFNNVTVNGEFAGTNFILNNSGLFLYSGTPAFGNLLVSAAPAPGTDTVGNTYPEGLKIWNGQFTLADPAQINMPTGAAIEAVSGNMYGTVIGSGAAEFLQALISGPKTNVVGDWVQNQWNSSNQGGTTSAEQSLIYVDSTGTPHQFAFLDKTGFNAVGTVTAPHPGTTPAVVETWQSLGAFSTATWTVNNGRYRITAEGECELDISLNAQAGGSVAGVFTWANNILAAYQFSGNYSRSYAFGFNGTITTATNSANVLVDGAGTATAGRVRCQLPALPATTNATVTVRIPLS